MSYDLYVKFQFITDPDVELCGSLCLSLSESTDPTYDPSGKLSKPLAREIQVKMLFGDTEIKASAIDVAANQTVRAVIDFPNEKNPKYCTKL